MEREIGRNKAVVHRHPVEGTEIGVVDARAIVKERSAGRGGEGEREGGRRGSRRRQEGEFVDLAGNGGGCSFSWRAKAEVGVDAFLPR